MMMSIDTSGTEPGAVIGGVSLSQPLAADMVERIEAAIAVHGVLVFRNQPLSLSELVTLGETFGPIDVALQHKLMNRVQKRLGHDGVSDISNVDGTGRVADRAHQQSLMNVGNMFWHSDASYEHYPFRYSLLSAVTAASWGGQTEFADLRAAYDALDDRTRSFIADKVGTFYSHQTRRWLGIEDGVEELTAYPAVRWPLVRVHPASGRRLLWIDSKVREISGMSIPEGRALAHELLEHIGQRERVYSHEWKPDDLVIWDNRSVVHRGRRFDRTERREMRRVSTVDDVCSLGHAERHEMPEPDARRSRVA